MTLDEIVVHNFGLYSERQTVGLSPPSPDKPIVLFGGLNGHGKTTLIDALQLCLYGPFASISNRNGQPYHQYLSRCLHRDSRTREAAVEIAFRHTTDGQENRYRLHRSWRIGKNGCKEHFEVLMNKRRDRALEENWISQVEDLIPPNIANLFLFDGEQAEGYVAKDRSMALVGLAIRNLLGLDIVDQLGKDLRIYTRRKRMEDQEDPMRDEIAKSEATLKALRTRIADLRQEQAALKTTRIDPTRKNLLNIEEEYRKIGGELYERRIEIEREKVGMETVLGESAARLREFAAGELPLLLVRDLLAAVHVQDTAEEEVLRARNLATVLENRDRELLERIRCLGIDDDTAVAVSAYLSEDRERRRSMGKQQTFLDLLPETRGNLNSLLRGDLHQLSDDVGSELRKRIEAQRKAEYIDLEYASVPDSDAVSGIAERRDMLRDEIATLQAKYTTIDDEIKRLLREIEHNEQSLARILRADARAKGEREDRNRILRHAARVTTILDTFRMKVIDKHVRKIERLVLESYQQLLRKESLVTRLEIDPESYAITLYDRNDRLLTVERLSAGERQLLAIALLWGLAKSSGRPLPTAIDTPLGRLDAGHRMHLVERYFPFASHQVLLLSTDEEIAGMYLQKLRPFVGRSYRLVYNDSTGSTKIVEGYFGDTEAA